MPCNVSESPGFLGKSKPTLPTSQKYFLEDLPLLSDNLQASSQLPRVSARLILAPAPGSSMCGLLLVLPCYITLLCARHPLFHVPISFACIRSVLLGKTDTLSFPFKNVSAGLRR